MNSLNPLWSLFWRPKVSKCFPGLLCGSQIGAKDTKKEPKRYTNGAQSAWKNTKNAIQNGLYWGYVGLVTYIIKKIQTKFTKKLFCVSTGGLSRIISKDINLINIVNENLTIYGLIEIFKLNCNEKTIW